MNSLSTEKLSLSGQGTRDDCRCPRCDALPKPIYQMLDTRTGKTVRLPECKCGERTWEEATPILYARAEITRYRSTLDPKPGLRCVLWPLKTVRRARRESTYEKAASRSGNRRFGARRVHCLPRMTRSMLSRISVCSMPIRKVPAGAKFRGSCCTSTRTMTPNAHGECLKVTYRAPDG